MSTSVLQIFDDAVLEIERLAEGESEPAPRRSKEENRELFFARKREERAARREESAKEAPAKEPVK